MNYVSIVLDNGLALCWQREINRIVPIGYASVGLNELNGTDLYQFGMGVGVVLAFPESTQNGHYVKNYKTVFFFF